MPETLTLSDIDQGHLRSVALGQAVAIRLGENPTTGYQWALDTDPLDGVEVLGSEYLPGAAAPGSAGIRVFHLKTQARGKVHLHLKLLRSWQSEGSPVETRDFTLQVGP